MFDQLSVEGAGKTNTSWTVTLSFAVEVLLICMMILVPLIWTEVLPKGFRMTMLTAPAPPPPPPPSPQLVQQAVKAPPRRFIGPTLQTPHTIPLKVAMIREYPVALLDTGGAVSTENSDAAGTLGGIEAAVPGIGPAPMPAPSQASLSKEPPAREHGPYVQSSGVQTARCLSCPRPQYPPIARQAHIQGSVVLQAIIAKNGTVQRLTAVAPANPLLTKAAMDAVSKWIYVPTILNHEPVEVITEITVNFALQ